MRMWDRILNALTLEPETDFEPINKKKISGKSQLLIRGIGLGILISILAWSDMFEDINALQFIMILCLGELFWGVFQKIEYLEELILHMLAVGVFVIISIGIYNIIVALALVGVLRILSDFDLNDLAVKQTWNFEDIVAWRKYHNRELKRMYGILGIALILMGIFFPELTCQLLVA